MFNADPANLTRPVPKVMRDAAEILSAQRTWPRIWASGRTT